MRNIGQPEARQHGYAQGAFRLGPLRRLHGFAHRALARIAAQRMRYQRQAAPGDERRDAAVDAVEKQPARVLAGFVHVDMRIGLETDDDVGIGDHLGRDVAVQVQRHPDGNARRGPADALQQVPFPIVGAFHRHRAMQVQQDRAATRRGRDDTFAQGFVGVGGHAAAGIGGGGYRRDQCRAARLGQVDEGRHRGALAVVLGIGVGIVGRTVQPEGGQRRGHRREGVGLVIHAGDKHFHAGSPSGNWIRPQQRNMACSSTLQPASRCSGCASSISLWLMPSLHGTKIMAVGATRAM
ncbi:hypothetical protein FQZ97_587670 [compost metagenome]